MSISQIAPKDAFQLLSTDSNSILVDVRTEEEKAFVGEVDKTLINNRAVFLPIRTYPDMDLNTSFIEELSYSLKTFFGENSKNVKIIFMCRSGARSLQSAELAHKNGYQNCINLTNGFEGELNNQSHRGKVNGWKASLLPWKQT
jgi:rhodanese-related sulfurtransferase